MKKSLLIDFGASRVKAAFFDGEKVFDIQSHNPIEAKNTNDKKFEIDLIEISKQFKAIVKFYYEKYKIDNVFISSQMHGFALLDIKNNPITDYISWKDERCLNKIDGGSSFDILSKNLGDKFLKKTGMNLRPCYPVFNLYHFLRENKIKEKVFKVATLADCLCLCDKKSLNVSHDTMVAGLGFYNIYEKAFDKDIIDLFKDFCVDIKFNEVTSKVKVGGYIEIDGKNIEIYTGFGDHQCAVFGAGNDETSISLNLGTGSQIAMINPKNVDSEKRPYFSEKLLSVITHIPSGRAFNTYINFLKTINSEKDYWQILSKITMKDIENADLNIDMAVFSSAWNYNNGGNILNINENNFTLRNYLASLVKSYIGQYEKGIEALGKTEKHSKIILSGGISKKIPVIKSYFENKGYNVELTELPYDEAIEGLKILSQSVNKEK